MPTARIAREAGTDLPVMLDLDVSTMGLQSPRYCLLVNRLRGAECLQCQML